MASSLYRWIDHAVTSSRRGAEVEEMREDMAALEAGRSLVFDPSNLPVEQRQRPPDVLFEDAARQLGDNIRKMRDLADRHSVPLLIALPVANRWSPPLIAAGDVLTRDPSPERDVYRSALDAIHAGRMDQARERLSVLLQSNPDDAGLHYWYGVALHRSGRTDAAAPELQAAIERDVRTHRITRRQEQALIETGGDRVVDLRPVLRAEGTGNEATVLFKDHCHPTAEGHVRIAVALLSHVERCLGL